MKYGVYFRNRSITRGRGGVGAFVCPTFSVAAEPAAADGALAPWYSPRSKALVRE
jgi:hypothetical protein